MEDFDLSFLAKPPSLLPIAKHKRSLQYTVGQYPVTIVVGQTGSGKTTQLPQYLREAGWCSGGKIIAVTQPRTIAVTNVATRVATETRCSIGQEVGYSIRFDDTTSSSTQIKFLTDGMLLREALSDPLLSRYSVIMIDEAHERSISSDILLGLTKVIRRKRPDLRIVVSSATIEAQMIADFYKEDDDVQDICKIVSIDGRTYPVDIQYLDRPADDYVQKAVDTVTSIHKEEPVGDVLVFFSGRDEIRRAHQLLHDYASSILPSQQALQPLPLYAGLSQSDQRYIFAPAAENTRKVILSTNVAEASVTVEGIVYVVDSGYVKLRTYNPITNIEALSIMPIARAAAIQRAGRAGRTKPGKTYRLFTEAAYQALSSTTPPEIERINLSSVILQLKGLGIDNIAKFPFFTSPSSKLVARALESLYTLGALDDHAKLTRPVGTRMAELGLPPMMAKALLSAASSEYNCLQEMLTIAAMTSLQSSGSFNIWFSHEGEYKAMDNSRRQFAAEEGDQLTYLNVYTAFERQHENAGKWCQQHHLNYKTMIRATNIRNQLARFFNAQTKASSYPLDSSGSAGQQDISLRITRCITTGYFANAARMSLADGTYSPVARTGRNTMKLYPHPTSLMFNRKANYVVFHELLETGDKTYIKDITKVEKNWLTSLSSGYYGESQNS